MKNSIHLFTLLALSGLGLPASAQEEEKPKTEELFTISYTVPPTFIGYDSGMPAAAAADPFAEPSPKRRLVGKSVRERLENVGISFLEGASVIYNPSTSILIVRNTRDQHELIEAYLDSIVADSEKQILVIYEMIEVDHLEFSDWLLSNQMDHDGTVLRKAAQEWVRAGRGTILHTTTVMARSGQRAKVESGSEYIYPTTYNPPRIPNQVSLSEGATAPVTGVTPTAFQTRNLGISLEVDPVIGSDNVTVDLNLAPELIELDGETVWATEEIDEMFQTRHPTFHISKVTTQVALHHGRYVLLGTTKPRAPTTEGLEDVIVLNFVRSDIGNVAKWSMEEAE